MQKTKFDADCPTQGDASNSEVAGDGVNKPPHAKAILTQYLLERSPEYRRLTELRKKV